jgi:hypothetical protein
MPLRGEKTMVAIVLFDTRTIKLTEGKIVLRFAETLNAGWNLHHDSN